MQPTAEKHEWPKKHKTSGGQMLIITEGGGGMGSGPSIGAAQGPGPDPALIWGLGPPLLLLAFGLR